MKRVAFLLLVALSARADEVAQGLENLTNIFRIAQYLELKRVVAEVPELPPAIDPWGNAYLVDPAAGRIVGAGSDGRFDRDRTEPGYPESYRRLRISGIIILELAISETGTIAHIATLKSLGPALDAAAIAAVRNWKFTPGTRDGQPIPTLFNLTINFKLN